MNGSDVLLDTNAAIEILNSGAPLAIMLRRWQAPAPPFPVLGELEFGALNSREPDRNSDRIERLLREVALLLPDRRTATFYGEIRLDLKRRGRPIPSNDVWIAALALQHRLPLLTRDGHFREVQGLDVRTW